MAYEVFRGSNLSILRSPAEEQKSLGFWFDGRGKRTVEDATWVNPSLVSRWMGTLSHREGWSPEELGTRWGRAKSQFGGKLSFLVRLAALPKQPSILDDDEPGKTNPEDLENLRCFIRYKVGDVEKTKELSLQLLNSRQSNDRDDILNVDWFTYAPALIPTVYKFPEEPGYPLGENYGETFLAQVNIPADLGKSSCFQLNVLSARKVRRATFWLSRS